MDILKLISRLLDYPAESLVDHQNEVVEMITSTPQLSDTNKRALIAMVNQRFNMDVLDWQAEYESLFERGRSLSLLIFEHVHGESRDRGQAMVDLLKQYKIAGLDIGVKELPDYLPLFLEFLSTQGEENAKGWLQDIAPVLSVLYVRLQKRDSNYQALFGCMLELSGAKIDLDSVKEQLKDEKRDDTNKALDKVWEEEAITFGGDAVNGGCPTATSKPSSAQSRDQEVPIHFVDASDQNAANSTLRN